MDWIKEQLNAGRAVQVIAALKRHCDWSDDGAVCILCYQANRNRMRCNLCG